MRGIPSLITEIRKKVFTEVARMAYSGDYTDMEDIPFKIVPGQSPLHRESVFLERAIAGERVRLAMGLSLQPVQTRTLLTEGMDQAAIAEQYYEPPLVNIIPYACHACPTKQYRVTELCQGCLASSCQRVCPKGAVKFVNGKSRIDQKLCIKCGKCARSCPYNAITYLERPCQAACGMDAIGVDEYGKACIDYDRCVSCGQCLVSCPFGAIVDKSQIYQVIRSMLEGNEVVAIVAPSFVGQFGKDVTVPKFLTAMKELGFSDVVEVAVGADICTLEEAHDFLEKVPQEQRFRATSWEILSARSGLMASSLIFENVGAITKIVRNSAMPTRTWFGGAVGVPRPVRMKPRTMRMRVKPVTVNSSAGTSVSEIATATATVPVFFFFFCAPLFASIACALFPRSAALWCCRVMFSIFSVRNSPYF